MEKRRPFKKHLPEIPVEDAHGGSGKRQLILSKTDAVSAALHALTKGFLSGGSELSWHSHEKIDEFFLVLFGKGRIEFEDGLSFDYGEGDLIYVPAGERHRILAETDSEFFFVRLDG